MKTINLDSRLSLVASFVRKGSRVADIGTDHAYIPVYLVQTGVSPSAVAADLRKMPLENAKKTIEQYNLSSKISTVLSDGLDGIEKSCCDDIVIAGMGGMLIAEILSKSNRIYDKRLRLVLQPMSHQEDVRKFLFENGFKIVEEGCSFDKKHCYCVIAAEFTGEKKEYSPAMIYTGTLYKRKDESAKVYLANQLSRLTKRRDSLEKAGTSPAEVESLSEIIDDYKKLTED